MTFSRISTVLQLRRLRLTAVRHPFLLAKLRDKVEDRAAYLSRRNGTAVEVMIPLEMPVLALV